MGDNGIVGSECFTLPVSVDIPESLVHVTLDIESETRSFGDGETEVKSDASWNASKTDEETPAVVDRFGIGGGLGKNVVLVSCDDNDRDDAGSYLNIDFSASWMNWRGLELTYRSYRSLGRRR